MDNFYMIVVLIAVVLLILCLTGIGILMRYQNAGQEYPPTSNTCPDGWSASGTSCISPALTGTTTYGTVGTNGYTESGADPNRKATVDFSNENWKNICNKKKWANKYGLSWDGVTNYSKCS
jgi:hypothetical protein